MGRKYTKEYYQQNREKIKQWNKNWTEKNREQVLTKKREYYAKNREVMKAKAKEHHWENRPEILERKRAYNAVHAVERNEKQKAYAAEHREQLQKYFQGYYAKNADEIKQAVKAWQTKTLVELEVEIRKIFDMKCFLCGEIDPTVKIGVCFHEKNRKNHDYSRVAEFKYILAHPQDFAPLCRGDHQMVHMLMRKGFSWEEIVELIRNKQNSKVV